MLAIGENVVPYGKVEAIASISGERYYFFIDRRGSVAMMPADVVETRDERSE